MLFETIKMNEKEEEDIKPCVYDLLKYEGGAVYLTRDGDSANIIIGQTYKEHFKQMGESGYLVNKALELWESLYG